MSQYQHMILGLCDVGSEAIGNAMAVAVGLDSVGPAFGNLNDIAGMSARPIGSDGPATVWVAFTLCKQSVVDDVAEFNGSGPYSRLNARGITDEQVTTAKGVLQAFTYPRATHEYALAEVLAEHGYEVVL